MWKMSISCRTDRSRRWNWRRPITKKAELTASFAAAAAIILIRGGPDALSVAACLMAAGVIAYGGDRTALAVSASLGAVSLMAGAPSSGTAFVITGSLIALAASESFLSRSLLLLSILTSVFFGAFGNLLPLAPASLAAVPLRKSWYRAAIIGTGLAVMTAAGGVPGAPQEEKAHAQELMEEGVISWEYHGPIDLSSPVLVLDDGGFSCVEYLWIRLSAGGVRDREPLGTVISGDSILSVMHGENTFGIADPEFPVTVTLTREWKPFSHPVIHFIGAEGRVEQAR